MGKDRNGSLPTCGCTSPAIRSRMQPAPASSLRCGATACGLPIDESELTHRICWLCILGGAVRNAAGAARSAAGNAEPNRCSTFPGRGSLLDLPSLPALHLRDFVSASLSALDRSGTDRYFPAAFSPYL